MNKPTAAALLLVFLVGVESAYKEGSGEENDCEKNLIFTINPKEKIYMVSNPETSGVVMLAPDFNLSINIERKTCLTYLIFAKTGKIIRIPPESCAFKSGNKNDYENFSVSELIVFALKNGRQFEPCMITSREEKEIYQIVSQVSAGFKSQCVVISTIMQRACSSSDALNTNLKGFEELTGNRSVKFRGDYIEGSYKADGWNMIFANVDGGLKSLIQKKVSWDVEVVLQKQTAIEVCTYTVKQFSQDQTLLDSMRKSLHSQTDFFVLATRLGGNIFRNVDGCTHLIAKILLYLKGKSSWENMEASYKAYIETSTEDGKAIRAKWFVVFKEFLEVVKPLGGFDEVSEMAENILHGCWRVNNVDMSKVCEMIWSGQQIEEIRKEIEKKDG